MISYLTTALVATVTYFVGLGMGFILFRRGGILRGKSLDQQPKSQEPDIDLGRLQIVDKELDDAKIR